MWYKIPVKYEMYGVLDVEANNIKEAVEKAKNSCEQDDYFLVNDNTVIKDKEYLDNSLEVNHDIELIDALNYYDFTKKGE